MPRREFDEVWDRDLMKQQLGEMRKESVRLKRELTRAKKVQEQTWRETSELRRLVQDGHLREKHLRSRYQDLLERSDGEPSAEPAGTRRTAVQASAVVERQDEKPPERVDPSLVDRAAAEDTSTDGWPTPELEAVSRLVGAL